MPLERKRKQIDEINQEILKLVNKRALYALEIGKQKAKNGLPIYDENRERLVLDMLVNNNNGPLTDEAIKRIFNKIIEECRMLQYQKINRNKEE